MSIAYGRAIAAKTIKAVTPIGMARACFSIVLRAERIRCMVYRTAKIMKV
ncbi:hypothetical protein PAMC26510_29445 [Caballeronia sordidicola]|uniref:Uncharacterized protein n=1 Tax=Caballeronia sordidicola TaxID=196367 RepID=A0A242MAM6_CABSO|nr:hypothetical protein PAMC26510_29445 [Caballeronia sordidicola]